MKHIQTAMIFLFAISSGSAFADAVTTRADLGADDNIQWGQFGPPETVFPTPAQGFSDGDLVFTVDDVENHLLQRFDQGDGWTGNFSPGDELVFSSPSGNPIVIDFDSPVFGVGANIQSELFGAFEGVIEVFDTAGNLIERFARQGDSNNNGDGSAIFIGIVSDTPIARATFEGDVSGAAINMVGLVTVPAPSSLALLGVAGLIVTRRRR